MPSPTADPGEPLSIWFFVGLILTAYGVLVVGAGLVYGQGDTVLAATRPGLWWGAIMTLAGAVFVALGRPRRRSP
jgi:hypothetical protein